MRLMDSYLIVDQPKEASVWNMKKRLRLQFSLLATVLLLIPSSISAQQASRKVDCKANATVYQPTSEKDKMAMLSPKHTSPQMRRAISSPLIARTRNGNISGTAAFNNLPKSSVNIGVKMWGASVYNTNSSEEHPTGMYEINGDGSMTYLGAESIYPSSGAWVVDNVYYALESVNSFGSHSVELVAYDTDTWERINDKNITYSDTELYATTVAYNYKNGDIYGCFYDIDTDNYYFAKADIHNGSKTVVCTLSEGWIASFFDDKNNLYIIDTEGDLYKVDSSDGDMSLIDTVGFMPEESTGAAYDSNTGKAYWAIIDKNEDGYMVEIDLSTGKGVKMFDFEYDDQICGLYIAPSDTTGGAPAVVGNFNVTFPNGALSGTATFTMPTTTFDGTAATGELSYTLYVDNEIYTTGKSSYGATVEVPVTVATEGMHTFAVIASNSEGDSPELKQHVFVGYDIPDAPKNVTATWADGVFSITWNAVTTSENDGYIDPTAITYTVTRYPDNVKVAENITGTNVTDNVAEPDNYTIYHYAVTALCNGKESGEGISNHIPLGKIAPPYSNSFVSNESAEGYTVIDANGDGKTWRIYDGRFYVQYNEDIATDDWVITPPVKLEAGKIYKISFDIAGVSAYYPEKYELCVGRDNTAEGMTTTLVGPRETTTNGIENNETYYTAESSGTYYFGVHGISDADMYSLSLYNFSISAPMSADAPCEVGNIIITPDAQGALKANVAFTAPAKNYYGDKEITEITKIEVYRDGTLVKTFENPAPGSALNFDDTVEESGTYRYEFVSFNSAGQGGSTSKSAFIGINVPGAPTNVNAKETANVGEVTVTWDAPTVDKDGNPINAALMTYAVYAYINNRLTLIADGINELSYTYQAVAAEDTQSFRQYAVFAATSTGVGEGAVSGLFAVGNPYTLPFNETFANAGLAHIYATKGIDGNPSWSIYDDYYLGVSDANGDNGYLCMMQYTTGSGMIYTGKVTLNASEPLLSFYTYNIKSSTGTADQNEITVCVSEDGGNTFSDLKTFVIGEECGTENDWNKLRCDLSAYAGKTIALGLKCAAVNNTYTLIDDINISDKINNDVALSDITAPGHVKPDEEFDVEIRLTNNGENDAKGVVVELYRNGVKVAEKDKYDIEAGEHYTVKFTDSLNVTNDKTNEYYAVAVYSEDQILDNNTSEKVTVELKIAEHPTVENLTGSNRGEDVFLKWDAPALTSGEAINDITDDFEDCASWGSSAGDWTFVDADGESVGGIDGLTLPGISGAQSYWVMDSSDASIAGKSSFEAHSGNKYLAQMYVHDGEKAEQCDDWAISPRLYGKAQTISFYAKSFSYNFPETFEVLYSTTDKETTSFTSLGTMEEVSSNWTEYSFDLPEGAIYFAIHCVSNNCFMLFIDDVSYTVAQGDYELLGYNIYREGVKLNDAPVTSTSYQYNDPEVGNFAYSVSAVYANGESEAVKVTIAVTEVTDIASDTLNITVENSEIVITNAEGTYVEIITPDGKSVARRIGTAEMRIAVEKGVYLVKVGRHTTKLIVK